MGKKVKIVPITPEPISVDELKGEKYTVTLGEKRTLFFVFKSDDISERELHLVSEKIAERVRAEAGTSTKAVVFCIGTDASFEIHEHEE